MGRLPEKIYNEINDIISYYVSELENILYKLKERKIITFEAISYGASKLIEKKDPFLNFYILTKGVGLNLLFGMSAHLALSLKFEFRYGVIFDEDAEKDLKDTLDYSVSIIFNKLDRGVVIDRADLPRFMFSNFIVDSPAFLIDILKENEVDEIPKYYINNTSVSKDVFIDKIVDDPIYGIQYVADNDLWDILKINDLIILDIINPENKKENFNIFLNELKNKFMNRKNLIIKFKKIEDKKIYVDYIHESV